jgi:hypothetical protein
VSEHVGTGPDGQNLLGFLCSVGVLAILDQRWPERRPRMRWELRECWRSVWSLDGELSDDELVTKLHAELIARREAPEFTLLGNKLPAPTADFVEFARQAAQSATAADRIMADFAAAYGCEAPAVRDSMQDTALRTMNTGQQQFLREIRKVHDVTPGQVHEALFGPWRYADKGPALRYDPIDDRRGALKASDPAKAEIWTVRAANALASEALRFFPCAPRSRLSTSGFSADSNKREPIFAWPIWTLAVTADVLRSLLNLEELTAGRPDRMRLLAMGVAEVFRSARVKNLRYRNFTPASPAT